MRDPFYVPLDEVAVPESNGPPDLTETLEIVEKARARLALEDISRLNSATGKKEKYFWVTLG
jgi:hypothetical protein